ncbi:PHP domain-containing protein [bacterium]|nr:PHP domain-containing protein [bacterium]
MKVYYDFHIHSALSPCADNNNTPESIIAMASVKGLDAIAVCDHNAIGNVLATMECGKEFGVTVLPAIEVQTAEEIHVVAIFKTFSSLQAFFNTLSFPPIKNDIESFGEQLIIDSENNIMGREERLLLVGANQGIYEITQSIIDMGGKAILAHIDRDANGILAILGAIPEDLAFSLIEFSSQASEEIKNKYKHFRSVINSDAHYLTDISSAENFIEADSLNIEDIFSAL